MDSYVVFFVEGEDDVRFFNNIVKPIFETQDHAVTVWDYSQEPPGRIRNFIKSINQIQGEYIFVTDLDSAPCVTKRKQKKLRKLNILDPSRILVVAKKIEGWYLAILDDEQCPRNLRKCCIDNTDNVDKEIFSSLKPKKYDSTTDFMIEILKYPSTEKAIQRNTSFRYFNSKHCS